MAQRAMGSFTEEAVKSVSLSLEEPAWLTELRLQAFEQFRSLPAEKNPLYTKYAFISAFDESAFGAYPKGTEADPRSFFKGYLTGKEANLLLQANQNEFPAQLESTISSAGTVLMPLRDAIRHDEQRMRRLFEDRLVKSEADRYAAFVNAFFNAGTYVSVPEGVVVGEPLRKMLITDNPTGGIIEQNFIAVGARSRLVFLEESYSRQGGSQPLVASTTEIRAAPGSVVDFSSIQLLNDQAVHVANRAIDVSSDSRVTVSTLALGSLVSRSRMNFLLNGRGAMAEGYEIFFTDDRQRYDFESNLVHVSPDTTGSTQARGVLKGESRSIFKGMIRIGSQAKNSRAYLAHHAMLLEKTAKSDGIPGLEILTNEVKATHSASVAQIDEEQLFYLMARGLPLDDARKMVVLGFFEPVLSRIPIEQTREGARFMIEGKWHGEKRTLADRDALIALTGETMPQVRPAQDLFESHYKYRQ